MNPRFENSFADGIAVSRISAGQPFEAGQDSKPGFRIPESREPAFELRCLPELDHGTIVAFRLRWGKGRLRAAGREEVQGRGILCEGKFSLDVVGHAETGGILGDSGLGIPAGARGVPKEGGEEGRGGLLEGGASRDRGGRGADGAVGHHFDPTRLFFGMDSVLEFPLSVQEFL